MDVILILLLASFIIFFGYFAEILFKKTNIPDVLLLIFLGFILGPFILKYIDPATLSDIAPLFITFALLFLLFDGAFNIDIASFALEISTSLYLTLFNFILSSAIITLFIYLLGHHFLESLMIGFILGGVSSAFVIPILKQLHLKQRIYTILTLESALTDVFCIVSALAVMELLGVGVITIKTIFSSIASLFAVAGLVGIIGAILWIILIKQIFKKKFYMITIAYVILIYVITEYLGGNGAIAALFLGLIFKNSKLVTGMYGVITEKQKKFLKEKKYEITKKTKHNNYKTELKKIEEEYGISITSREEEFFYNQISFFLKVFFFVYIGLLIDLTDMKAIVIGIAISFLILLIRKLNLIVFKKWALFEKKLLSSIYARGIAAATLAQIVVSKSITTSALFFVKVITTVIVVTILFSSFEIFLLKIQVRRLNKINNIDKDKIDKLKNLMK